MKICRFSIKFSGFTKLCGVASLTHQSRCFIGASSVRTAPTAEQTAFPLPPNALRRPRASSICLRCFPPGARGGGGLSHGSGRQPRGTGTWRPACDWCVAGVCGPRPARLSWSGECPLRGCTPAPPLTTGRRRPVPCAPRPSPGAARGPAPRHRASAPARASADAHGRGPAPAASQRGL